MDRFIHTVAKRESLHSWLVFRSTTTYGRPIDCTGSIPPEELAHHLFSDTFHFISSWLLNIFIMSSNRLGGDEDDSTDYFSLINSAVAMCVREDLWQTSRQSLFCDSLTLCLGWLVWQWNGRDAVRPSSLKTTESVVWNGKCDGHLIKLTLLSSSSSSWLGTAR